MFKRLDLGVERVVADHEAGTLEVPSVLRIGLAEGAIGYSTSGEHSRASTIAALRELEASIVSGEIVVAAVPSGPPSEPPNGIGLGDGEVVDRAAPP